MSSAPDLDAILAAFDLQARWTAELGSHFNAELVSRMRADIEAGGPVAALVAGWPRDPVADALPTRLMAALHAAAISARDPALAAEFPEARQDWSIARLWPRARDFLARERAWVADFISSPPQTNETQRALALLPGFLRLARFGPLHLLEIGASAGLLQMWDTFRYETPSWRWGEAGGARIAGEWIGAAPADLDVRPRIALRRACDRAPLDVSNPDHVLRLRAYVWADQPERRARLDRAIETARAHRVQVDQADAADWLAHKLAAPLAEGVTVIFHSIMWQYMPAPTQHAIRASIEAAGARADSAHRLAWLRFEPNPVLGVDARLETASTMLQSWPGGGARVVCEGDGHAKRLRAL